MTYFKNVHNLQELRKQYRDLLKQYHPDNGGSEEITKAINIEYEQLFQQLKNACKNHSADSKHTQKESYENMRWDEIEDEILRDILSKVIHFTDITIEIIGNWLWIGGNSYQYRKELKELGFKFAGNKKMWYWHSEVFRKKSHKKLSINDIRKYYGSTNVSPEYRELLEA